MSVPLRPVISTAPPRVLGAPVAPARLLPPISGLTETDLHSAVAQAGRFVIFRGAQEFDQETRLGRGGFAPPWNRFCGL